MKQAVIDDQIPAIEGGTPVRTEPLPLEFPGVHHMDEEEIEAAVRLLKSRSLFRYYGIDAQGEVEAFESEFARFAGVKHALAVSSGTGALHVAMGALGVGPGQEVIVPAYLWVSVIAAVVNRGAIPVVADIDDTFCLDPRAVAKAITDKTAGIIFTHMSGAPGDAPAVAGSRGNAVCSWWKTARSARAAASAGGKAGTFGDIGIFSFQMNKNMTAGEGGCVVTDNADLYRRAFACHDLGYVRDENGRLIFDRPDLCLWGMGYRMDELRAAVLRVQLRKLPRITGSMRASKYRIRAALSSVEGIQLRRILDAAGDTGCFLITTFAGPRYGCQNEPGVARGGHRDLPARDFECPDDRLGTPPVFEQRQPGEPGGGGSRRIPLDDAGECGIAPRLRERRMPGGR